MRVPPEQFTIRSLMIAVAVVACLFVIPYTQNVFLLVLIFPFLALISAKWLVFREYRQVAALCFGGLAFLTNVLYTVACTYPHYMILPALFLGWFVIVAPMITGPGAAWAILATHETAVPRRASHKAWLSVLAVTVLPLATVVTLWPLRLAFLTARPTLEVLADQVAAGRAVRFPQRAGPFQLVGTAVDPSTRNVGLIIDPHPSGPTGFVRINRRTPPDRAGPFSASGLGVDLGCGWEYRQED